MASGTRLGEDLMAKVAQNVVLSPSRDVFNKLVLTQSNVRRIKAGVSIEELAEDIARRGLLQSLNVRHVRDPGWWSPLPGNVAPGEAEAAREDGADPLHRLECCIRDPDRR